MVKFIKGFIVRIGLSKCGKGKGADFAVPRGSLFLAFEDFGLKFAN